MYVMGIATCVTINLPFRCGAHCIIKYISKLYSKLLSLQQIDIMKFLSLHLYGHYAEYHFVIIRGSLDLLSFDALLYFYDNKYVVILILILILIDNVKASAALCKITLLCRLFSCNRLRNML